MKVRKFVSAFSALTIAASAFAGMAITASAATTVSYDFEDGIAAASDISRMADCTVVDSTLGNNATKVQKIGGNTKGKALAGLETPIDMTADNIVQVEFDYTMDARHTDLSLRGTQPTTINARDYSTTGRFLRIGSNNGTSGIVFVDASGETFVADPGEWVHVKTVIDFGSGKMDNDVYTYSANGTYTGEGDLYSKDDVAFLDTSLNSIWGFSVYDETNSNSNSFVDNIELRSLTAPKFTMAEDPVNVTVGAQSNVSVTDVTGVISVESEDTNIATATYSNGNIVIEGVSQGVAVITVTAENDGLSTSKSFTAIVGDVATKDVTVNFFVTGTSTPVKDAVTINDVAVGATIGADDIDTETITNDIGRYTYNSSASTALPYQVSDGENVINIYYDEALAVTNLTINYKAGDQIVATGTRNLTGLYVGDTASYTDAYYVKGDDGTIYSTQGEMFTTDADETSISSTTVSQDYLKYNKTVLLTTAGSQTIEQTVEVSPNAVYFSEAEDLGLSVTTQGVNTARYIFSCGTGMRGRTGSDGIGIYEVPASGTYQIVVSGGNSRKYETAIFKSAEAAAAASSYTGEGALVSFGTTDNSVYGMYTVKTVELDKGDVLTLKGFGDKNTTYVIDYIMVRQLSTDPTATYSQIGDYTTETGTDDNGSAFTFTVTPGSETITSVGVKVNGIEADRTAATEITSGSAVFAVAVDTSADKVESITAVLNGADVEAVETTTVE